MSVYRTIGPLVWISYISILSNPYGTCTLYNSFDQLYLPVALTDKYVLSILCSFLKQHIKISMSQAIIFWDIRKALVFSLLGSREISDKVHDRRKK